MLLFPCNRVDADESRIGFTITNWSASKSCRTRIFLNDEIVDDVELVKFNNFIEIPINNKNFHVSFQFSNDFSQTPNKFSISNLVWLPEKNLRRNPICFFKDNPYGETDIIYDKFLAFSNEKIDMRFENFLQPDDRHKRINNIIINGVKQKISVPYISLVHDFRQGISIFCTSAKLNVTVPFSLQKLRLKIVDKIDEIHQSSYIRDRYISNENDYFEFIRTGYNIATMNILSIGKIWV